MTLAGDVATHQLPTGSVTFLLTDVEDSTPAWEREPREMAAAMERHTKLVDDALARHNGVRPRDQGEGDNVVAAFESAGEAVTCALELQRAFAAERWPTSEGFRVRMAVHTGEADVVNNGNYQGVAIIRAARVRSFASGGQILLSSSTASLVADRLPEDCTLFDLGFHALKGLSRPERVSALQHPDLAPVGPMTVTTAPASQLHVPAALTSFVGRDAERRRVVEALAANRVVTVLGEGGAGKTRLAMEVSTEVVSGFADGVWMIDLAPADAAGFGVAMAKALGVALSDDQPIEQAIVDHVKDKTMLIVLDNAEHLLGSVRALVSAVLLGAGDVGFLVTSQAPTRAPGEVQVRLDAMAPEDAVRLFVERARAVTSADLPAEEVAALCERLERLPLAIELAAARVSVLSVGEIAKRLDDSFRLLRTETGPDRHRTMGAVLDWSHDLLDDRERTVFRRLAIFPGEFGLGLAESIACGGAVDELDVLDVLTALIDRSLVRRHDADGASRYRLLAPVRAYAAERLREAGEDLATSRHLMEAIRGVVETAEIRGPNGGLWSARLFAEIDSIRAALSFAATDEQSRVAAAFVVECTARLWSSWGLSPEAKMFTAALLATGPPPGAEASLRYAAGFLEGMSNNIEAARHEIETGINRAREAGDRRVLSALLRLLGILSWNFEHTDAAFIPLEEALEVCRELGDEIGVIDTTYAAGMVAWQGRGDLATGGRMIEEAVRRYRELGDRASVAECETCVASLALQRGEYDESLALWQSIVAEFRSLGDRSMTAMALFGGGLVASWSGRLDVARSLISQASSLSAEIGEALAVTGAEMELARIDAAEGHNLAAACTRFSAGLREANPDALSLIQRYTMVLSAADLLSRRGDHGAAARLFGALADVAPRASILPDEMPPSFVPARDETRAKLGDDAYAAAAAEGVGLEWRDLFAIAAALHDST